MQLRGRVVNCLFEGWTKVQLIEGVYAVVDPNKLCGVYRVPVSFQCHTESQMFKCRRLCMDGHPEPHTQQSEVITDFQFPSISDQMSPGAGGTEQDVDLDLACAVLHNVGIERNNILRNLTRQSSQTTKPSQGE
jgi:hypothetical protein